MTSIQVFICQYLMSNLRRSFIRPSFTTVEVLCFDIFSCQFVSLHSCMMPPLLRFDAITTYLLLGRRVFPPFSSKRWRFFIVLPPAVRCWCGRWLFHPAFKSFFFSLGDKQKIAKSQSIFIEVISWSSELLCRFCHLS